MSDHHQVNVKCLDIKPLFFHSTRFFASISNHSDSSEWFISQTKQSPQTHNWFRTFSIILAIKICITSGFEQQCAQLDRESTEVECIRVQDSVECAKLLRGGTAGFGIFSAESMLLLATLKYDSLTVLKELRHRDRLNRKYESFCVHFRCFIRISLENTKTDTSDFEAAVIVKSNYEGGIKGLKGLKYCHPGFYYGRTERWSERFLRQFERTILTPDCDSPLGQTGSPAEIEVATVANYFGSSCRPGAWSNNLQEDQRLSSFGNSFVLFEMPFYSNFNVTFLFMKIETIQKPNIRSYANCAPQKRAHVNTRNLIVTLVLYAVW